MTTIVTPEEAAKKIAADFVDTEFDDEQDAMAWLIEKVEAAIIADREQGTKT